MSISTITKWQKYGWLDDIVPRYLTPNGYCYFKIGPKDEDDVLADPEHMPYTYLLKDPDGKPIDPNLIAENRQMTYWQEEDDA